jgi:hypothetical protein
VGEEFLHADQQTDMTKLIVAFRNFANAPIKGMSPSNGANSCFTFRRSQVQIPTQEPAIVSFVVFRSPTNRGQDRALNWAKSYMHFCAHLHFNSSVTFYRGADKSLARPTSQCILFDGENISIDANLVIYINSTNIPPVMIINRIYENQNLLSL